MISIKVLCAATSYSVCAVRTPFIGAERKHFSFRRKSYKVLMPALCSDIESVFLFAELNDGKKKTWRSSQDSNLGPLNSGQMLLPTEPLELWNWSRE